MKIGDTIYLDHNATTPVDPRVLEVMMPFFSSFPGNASSRNHALGWMAEDAVSMARQKVSDLIHSDPKEIIFTSGATESINTAIKGVMKAYHSKGNHIITSVAEHNAVLDTCRFLEKNGHSVTYLKVDENGRINLDELKRSLRDDTVLVALMLANNETGVIEDAKAIGKICHDKNVFFFCDATQAVGKVPIDVKKDHIHLMSFSGHKMYGPKGVGALYMSQSAPRIKLIPLLHGGGHESDLRSGTLNVPGIVGLGEACLIAQEKMGADALRLNELRTLLEHTLINEIEAVTVNGDIHSRLAHVSNLRFLHVDGEALMTKMGVQIAVASGSACTSSSADPSHVLLGMGLSEREAKSCIRFSLGRYTTREDIETTCQIVQNSVHALRSISPVWEMYQDGIL